MSEKKWRRAYPGHDVVARDREKGWVLLDGFGIMGMCTMWFKDDPKHAGYDGYDDAMELPYQTPEEMSESLSRLAQFGPERKP